MKVSAHQPSYFPWLGWLHKVKSSDLFILMDEVQLSDSAYQHRNIFLTNDGKTKFLTIPFDKKGYKEKNIKDLTINNQVKWQKNHFNFIKENNRKHLFFSEIIEKIEPMYTKKYDLVFDFLLDNIRLVFDLFQIETKMIIQSDMSYDRNTSKNELVLELVQNSGLKTYLSGQGAKSYLELDRFKEAGIEVEFQHFSHPEYVQKSSLDEFSLGLNCSDILFNLGIQGSRALLKSIR